MTRLIYASIFTITFLSMVGCARITKEEGALGGAALGAGVGAIYGSLAGGINAGNGAIIGALAGGLAGALIGAEESDIESYVDQIAALTAQRNDLQAQLDKCEAEKAALEASLDEGEEKRAVEAENARLRAQIQDLESRIASLQGRGIQRPVARFVISSDLLFSPGSADLTDEGKSELDRIAAQIAREHPDKSINIAGHTDSDPIRSSQWTDNWELGAARAASVLRYLERERGVAGGRLSATTYGANRPASSNDSDRGKAENRRAEIIVYTEE